MKLLLTLAVLPIAAVPLAGWALSAGPQDDDGAQDALTRALAGAGIHLDLEAGACALPVVVEVRDDLLEYLLAMPHGAAHEAMFLAGTGLASAEEAETWAQSLNAALLALGVEPGTNAQWVDKDPPPTEDQMRAGISPYDVRPPAGDGFFLYAAWREGDELFLYRCEDLVRDLDSQRTMRRHRWVFLGSRLVTRRDGREAFAAGIEGNLINISFFPQGNTVITAALEECLNQTTWLPNAWLLPDRGEAVLLVFSRDRLDRLPSSLEERVPVVRGR